MIYPFIDEETIPDSENLVIPEEYEIDFETGQLTGRIVEGLDAVKVWIWIVLQTAKNRFYIYSQDFGQDFDELVGTSYTQGYVEMEYERMIEECLSGNEYIEGIENYEFRIDEKGEISINFKIRTIFGEEEVNVRGNDLRINFGTDA